MQVTKMKLVDLVRPEKNIRIHTDAQIREFKRSIEMFGQIRPIVVDENNVILAGNGLYETLLAMGETEADVYKYDNLTANQKKKLMIADNKIFALGIENLDTLNSFLEELSGDLDIPGYDEEILKQMVAEAEDITEKISEYGTLDQETIDSIKAGEARRERAMERTINTENTEVTEQPVSYPVNEGAPAPVQESPTSQVSASAIGEAVVTADVRKFVVCPHCGEKVWL